MEELTGLDARFLYSETSTAHMHTMKVVVVDVDGRSEALTPAGLTAAIVERLDRMPGLRRSVVTAPRRVSHPVWVEAPFDPDEHIRWCRVDPPGDRVALAALVAEIAGSPLPRSRPLWELVVVEGLADRRIAFVMKLHHALADGVAAAAMLENIFQGDAERAVVEPANPEPLPRSEDLSRLAWRSRLHRTRRLPALLGRNVAAMASARRQRRALAVQTPVMFSGPRTALNVSLSDRRTFAVTDLQMAAVNDIRSRHGVTVNDVFLAVCGGALRQHLGAETVVGRGLVAGVPIGAPGSDGRLSGNHLDHMLVALRTDLADPVTRLRAIAQGSAAARAERAALGLGLFEDRADHTPPGLYPLVVRLWASTRLANRLRPPLNVIASSVAGPRTRLCLDGAVVSELWSVGPILEGIGLNITAWSYAGVLRVAALGCPESLPDPWRLMGRIDEALAELATASRRSGAGDHRCRPMADAVRA